MRLKTNNIESTTIEGVAREIEENHMSFVQHVCENNGWAVGDAIEAIATHIVVNDEDYIIESENMRDEKYNIELAYDQEEADEFCEFLNAKGHRAIVGTSTGNHVGGIWTSTDEEANKILNDLWDEYCK